LFRPNDLKFREEEHVVQIAHLTEPAVHNLSPDPTPSTGFDRRPQAVAEYPWYDSVGRMRECFDRAAGLLLFVLALPLTVAGWVVVKLTSSGPGLYTQTRVGLAGRHFCIYKLRTMYHNCEVTMGGVRWSSKGDPRVTPVGRVLRKLHVDELPQLWNVVVGDMSLVGPRPERPELVAPLSRQIEGYTERLAVPPGLTGLAQIQLPPDTDLDSVRAKLRYDRSYIARRSPWLDLRLLFGTGVYLLGVSYVGVRRIALLPDADKEATEQAMTETREGVALPRPTLGEAG
jgi:lipopolysaccharide/colanic/teichoic acid biosynthesis glycosyltransferase